MDRSFSGVSARIFLFHGTKEDVSTLKNIYQYKYEYLFNSKKIQKKDCVLANHATKQM